MTWTHISDDAPFKPSPWLQHMIDTAPEETKPRRMGWREVLLINEQTFIDILSKYYTTSYSPYHFQNYFEEKVSPTSQVIWRRCMADLSEHGWHDPKMIGKDLQFKTLGPQDLKKRFATHIKTYQREPGCDDE